MAKPHIFWKAHYVISKIVYNIVLYPETIRMMTRSNKVTHKMKIIGKFTMPRILWSFIDCVSTLQLWTSHTFYEKTISPSQHAEWRGTVKRGCLCWAAFKQGHHKFMNVRNCAIPHTLHNFWLLTSASPIGHLLVLMDISYIIGKHCLSPWQCSTQPNHQMM